MKDYISLFDTCIYRFESRYNVMEEKDLGITGDISSMLTPENSVSAMNCFQGCPYTNTAFRFDVITDGEKVRAASWKWLPNAMYRVGETEGFTVQTVTAVIPGMRTVVQKITYTSKRDQDQTVPIHVAYRGCTRYEADWTFSIPEGRKGELSGYAAEGRILSHTAKTASWRLTSS
ncbi:MAG: hypothetical protein IKM07_04290, partial [Clostridia bacterium]|nr:hypothetical protein [Clostridia bacterium]